MIGQVGKNENSVIRAADTVELLELMVVVVLVLL